METGRGQTTEPSKMDIEGSERRRREMDWRVHTFRNSIESGAALSQHVARDPSIVPQENREYIDFFSIVFFACLPGRLGEC